MILVYDWDAVDPVEATYLSDPVLNSPSLGKIGNLGPVFIGICRCTEGGTAGMCRSISGVTGHGGLGVGVTLTPMHCG